MSSSVTDAGSGTAKPVVSPTTGQPESLNRFPHRRSPKLQPGKFILPAYAKLHHLQSRLQRGGACGIVASTHIPATQVAA